MMYYYNDFYPMHSIFGPIFMIIFWALVIWGILGLVRHFSGHPHNHKGSRDHNHNRAIEILKERYAKGEITKEHFESMKKDLQ